jgi:GTPase SAR1 family protein
MTNFKIVVGKSSLVEPLVSGSFNDETEPSISKSGTLPGRSVSKQSDRGIRVFDLTNRQSFDDLNLWINDLQTLCAPNAQQNGFG